MILKARWYDFITTKTKVLSVYYIFFVLFYFQRGTLFGSPQRSTLDLDVINRPQLEAPKLDK